jgi:hypothetical protein
VETYDPLLAALEVRKASGALVVPLTDLVSDLSSAGYHMPEITAMLRDAISHRKAKMSGSSVKLVE